MALSPAALRGWARLWRPKGGGKVYTDPKALIADPKVEAVVVASPDPFHAEAAWACIKAGKPVLCEKPLATNLADRTDPAPAPTIRKTGQQFQTIDEDWLVRFETAYIAEVQAWVQSLIQGKPTGPSTWDGYAAMVVADACVQSTNFPFNSVLIRFFLQSVVVFSVTIRL